MPVHEFRVNRDNSTPIGESEDRTTMNASTLEGQWEQVRGMLKKRWGQLTDDDLRFANGNVDQLIGRIHQRTGEAREAIEQFLDQATNSGAALVSDAVKAVGDYARDASSQVRERYNRISDQFGQQFDRSQEWIRERPAHSVATALAVGVLFGVVIGLALRSRP
jgi:uncharacterized protein YjbJ (UPF0337 family)